MPDEAGWKTELLEEVKDIAQRMEQARTQLVEAERVADNWRFKHSAAIWEFGDWLKKHAPVFRRGPRSAEDAAAAGFLTQAEVAKATGQQQSSLSRWRRTAEFWPADKRQKDQPWVAHWDAMRAAGDDGVEAALGWMLNERPDIMKRERKGQKTIAGRVARRLTDPQKLSELVEALKAHGTLDEVAGKLNRAVLDEQTLTQTLKKAPPPVKPKKLLKPLTANEEYALSHIAEAQALYKRANRHLEAAVEHTAALNPKDRATIRQSLNGVKGRITFFLVRMERSKELKKNKKAA